MHIAVAVKVIARWFASSPLFFLRCALHDVHIKPQQQDKPTMRGDIASMHKELKHLEKRVAAYLHVHNAIQGNEAFTQIEQDMIERNLRAAEAELREKELMVKQHSEFVEITLVKCKKDLKVREGVLDKVFADECMREHNDIMEIFSSHHDSLLRLSSESESN